MSFSKTVKEEALVKSRRSCCVCHEFAGLYVNVHHIVQRAEGGSNDIGNAIMLCLRCHGEAGHYNLKHPIGNKYSPEELIKHRDEWWQWCEDNPSIPLPHEKEIRDKIEQIRDERINKIRGGKTPLPFYDNAKIVLHMFPFSTIVLEQEIDINKAGLTKALTPMRATYGYSWDYNYDGFYSFVISSKEKCRSYVQLFRNGCIEAVEGLTLNPTTHGKVIPGILYETQLVNAIKEYLEAYKLLAIEPPFYIYISLIGVKDYAMATLSWDVRDSLKITEDDLILNVVIINSYDDRPEDVLRPIFNRIWNACGYSRSIHYDEYGNWLDR